MFIRCVAPQTADIWLQVAADHLSREDCVALSSTCRFMRNLLLPSAFSLLSIYSPRGLNHVLTRKQRKKMLTANESENSPFLAAFRRIYVGCILTRTQDDVIRFNLPLMANLSVFRGRYRANNHAMRVYAILRMMPTLKELSLYWKVTCTNTNSRDIAFEHPPMCALTMISTSGAILDDLLNRTDSPCIKSFEELWIRYPLEMNEAIAQLTRLGPFPSFQRVKVVSALGMRPQSLWDLFAAHLFITSVVIHRALSAPLTEAECIRLPQNLRVLSIDNEAITRLVYVALEKHRGADGGFAVTGALETALSQCSQLEELILIGKINTSAPFIALFKSLILTSHISLKKLSLIFHRSPPLVDVRITFGGTHSSIYLLFVSCLISSFLFYTSHSLEGVKLSVSALRHTRHLSQSHQRGPRNQ